MKDSRKTNPQEANAPVLPSQRRIGSYSRFRNGLLWTRNVQSKHLLRFLDGWSINRPLADQLEADAVDTIRYVYSDGTYTVSLKTFLSEATILKSFAKGEDVFVLPRDRWDFEPNQEAEPLIMLLERDK